MAEKISDELFLDTIRQYTDVRELTQRMVRGEPMVYLEKPVYEQEAEQLANEMFLLCMDIMLQGSGSIRSLKQSSQAVLTDFSGGIKRRCRERK